jgi:hypothetical protein
MPEISPRTALPLSRDVLSGRDIRELPAVPEWDLGPTTAVIGIVAPDVAQTMLSGDLLPLAQPRELQRFLLDHGPIVGLPAGREPALR